MNDLLIKREMTAVENSLFMRIGGGEAIFAVVQDFYSRIMTDSSVMGFFKHLDMQSQINKQTAFLTMAFGGPNEFTGKDLRVAHAPFVEDGLNDVHFDAVAQHLKSSLIELGVEKDMIAEVLELVETTRSDVLSR